jgi:benzil reductase ((S)-benzoin forming)
MTSHPRSLAFVTGTSSGIGEAAARDLLGRGWQVIGVARRAASIRDPNYTHLRLDLADLAGVSTALDAKVRPLLAGGKVTRLGLVNNAALVGLLGPISTLDAALLAPVYTVNTAAPILLMGWFVRQTVAGVALRIANVSTGAAVNPYPGLGAYGTSKAALRMAGMVLATELDLKAESDPRDVSILSYEPGLVDTPMQTTVRTSSVEVLPVVQVFVNWAADGVLVAPEQPVKRIADYLGSDGHPRWMELRFEAPPPSSPPHAT